MTVAVSIVEEIADNEEDNESDAGAGVDCDCVVWSAEGVTRLESSATA